jgi:hypothetical protein
LARTSITYDTQFEAALILAPIVLAVEVGLLKLDLNYTSRVLPKGLRNVTQDSAAVEQQQSGDL